MDVRLVVSEENKTGGKRAADRCGIMMLTLNKKYFLQNKTLETAAITNRQ